MTDTNLALRPARALIKTTATELDLSRVVGWGVDADPKNNPTYPYRDRSADDHSGQWVRPTLQRPDVELLQSVEHKQRPAVFGTASPPKWVSGWIRRLAFRWSESNWTHWLLLMGADRVNMVEGLVEDISRAKIPNVPKEMGLPAHWKHNRAGLAGKLAVGAVVAGAIFAVGRARRMGNAQRDPPSR